MRSVARYPVVTLWLLGATVMVRHHPMAVILDKGAEKKHRDAIRGQSTPRHAKGGVRWCLPQQSRGKNRRREENQTLGSSIPLNPRAAK